MVMEADGQHEWQWESTMMSTMARIGYTTVRVRPSTLADRSDSAQCSFSVSSDVA